MILLRLYSEPEGLFDKVEFKQGFNIIYGKKDSEKEPKSSLNSIGKSTFLDLLDFCLLCSFNATHNARLFAAKDIMSGYNIVLEFRINEKKYIIKRTVDEKQILFGEKDTNNLKHFELEELKQILSDLIFYRENYEGDFNRKWFRNLITFYLKIQKFKKDNFSDPIQYLKGKTEIETNIYQLYLLGINNFFSNEVFKSNVDLKKLLPAIREIEKLLTEKYKLNDLSGTNQNINKLKYEINKLEISISNFQLNEEYEDVEKKANILTQTIKDKWFQNFSDKNKIEAYQESFDIPDRINTVKIKNIYKELSEKFAIQVKKTLDEAILFRKQLSQNRRNFLQEEIDNLTTEIHSREKQIVELEKERAECFNFLANEKAIKDLTGAFNILSDKKSKLSDLESNTKILNDLLSEKKQIETKLKETDSKIFEFINNIKDSISKLYNLFTEVFNKIYMDYEDESCFSINYNAKKDKKLDIDISMPDMYGKGKNQGRTLIYDLFVLLNSFSFENHFPKFLIHDGIFDGVDKAHFIAVYEYIESLKKNGLNLQYITTINEEGTLNDKFGNVDKVSPEKLEKEAILVLSPNNKLFKRNFKKIN